MRYKNSNMMRKANQVAASPPQFPAPGQGKRGVDGYLGYLLQQAAGAHRLRMTRALADLAVTPPQFTVMTMLGAYSGLSNADLARLALLTPQTLSVIVGNLERDGVVTRRAHAIHGRIQHVDLSEAGRKLLARCRKRVLALEERLAGDFSPDALLAARRWLVSVAVPPGERPES